MPEFPIEITSRARLFEIIDAAMEEHRNQDSQFAVLLISIKKFRQVNLAHGFQMGDALLIEFHRRLQQIARERDLVLRIGNSEFLLFVRNVLNEGHATLAAVKLRSEFEETVEILDRQLKVSFNIGIAIYPDHARDASSLLQNAEIALTDSRHSADAYCSFSENDELDDATAWDIVSELRVALDQDQLELYFQPQIELESGRVYGAEALLRWKHPQRGFVRPDYFIPIAEHNDFIREITEWTIRGAFWLAKDWPDAGSPLKVAINLSPRLFEFEGLIESISNSAGIFDVSPECLTLEVTESAFMEDMAPTIRTLNHLRDMGVNISIDDFGTGYSSMSYFKRIPANELKIDRSFVTNMLENPMDLHIVRSIIDMAQGFGLKVVAEGIEDRDSLEFLKTINCDIAQGLYICEALPQDRFVNWLNEYNAAIS